jgi:hypothetical protein
MIHLDRLLLIRYGWLPCCVLVLFFAFSPVCGQEPKPEFATAQRHVQAATFLSANSSLPKAKASTITTIPTPSLHTVDDVVSASDRWNTTTAHRTNVITSALAKNEDKPSKLLIPISSNEDITYNYPLGFNNTGDMGTGSQFLNESRFVRWIDTKEKAVSAFIPEGWNADLQIIRPYKSMTGFVFFARGGENTLVYVFQPFMPLYLLPSKSLCEADNICLGSIISAEKVRQMFLGNAPIAVSNFKTPEQYFTSEVLPMLKKNLNAYAVDSAKSILALVYGNGNNSSDLVPAYEVDYNFNVENKKISGRAMILTRNHTAYTGTDEEGIWNGFIVGIESSEKNFDNAFQQAAVTLLTLQFKEEWLNNERKVLLENANTSQALGVIPQLMANSTLDDFYLIIPTAAHELIRSYNNTMIARYLDKTSGKELDLPLFPELQHWYINGDQLVSTDLKRSLMNTSSLEPLL